MLVPSTRLWNTLHHTLSQKIGKPNTVKPAHVVTSIKQSPVLKGQFCHALLYIILYELNLF